MQDSVGLVGSKSYYITVDPRTPWRQSGELQSGSVLREQLKIFGEQLRILGEQVNALFPEEPDEEEPDQEEPEDQDGMRIDT